MNVRKGKQFLINAVIYLILICLCIFVLYPIVWIIIGSLNPGDTLYSTELIPSKLTFKHYIELFTKTNYATWYKNTLFICFFTMILATIFTLNTAYALSRFRFRGRKTGMLIMLVLQMFPTFMGLIAIYVLMQQLNLLDNIWGMILVYTGTYVPFNAWLMKGYFDSIPESIEEAAKIDGASNVQIYLKIMLPLSKPMITFVAINSFIMPWMDFILSSLILRSNDKRTLAVGLFDMVRGRTDTDFTTFAAGAVLVAIPITILYMIFQKWMIHGLSAGAEKG